MATDNKDFKVKNGLVVQGATATVDGEDVLTKSQANIDYLNSVVGEIYSYGENPPTNPNIGDRWVDSATGYEYTWLDDGTSTQWVETRGSGYVGPSNELTVGTVSTGAAGSNVSVDITGESPAQTINFTIPRGDKGDQGDQGIQGIQGEQGLQGIQGPAPWTLIGAYDNGADYGYGDAVTYAGGFYYRTGNPNNPGYPPTPGSINASWTPVADRGATGETGEGVPAGGAGGYVLAKASATDFDTHWVVAASGGGGSINTSDTAPTFPNDGDIWYDTTDGNSYVFVEDVDGGQWVGFSADPVGPAGIGIPPAGNASQILAKITNGDYATEWIDLPPSELALQTDVDLTTPVADGQVLAYNDTTSVWENKTLDISATEVSDTAPVGATEGDAWFDSSLGTLYIYTSGVWVEVKANSALDSTIPTRVDTVETNVTFLTTRVNSIEPTVATMITSKANVAGPNAYNGTQTFIPANSAATPVLVRAVNAQTADLMQWQDAAGSTIARIDFMGRQTLSNQPRFQAFGASGTSGTSGQDWIFPSTYVNVGSYYNTSNGRFTAPITGTYIFYWSNIGNNQNTVYRYFLRKNGSNFADTHLRLDSGTAAYKDNGDRKVMMNLASGDYINIYFMSDNGSSSYNVADSQYPWFGGYLLA